MTPIVMIVDQRQSRASEDRIPGLVSALNETTSDLLMPFQRTIGDECEGVLASCRAVPRLVSEIARQGNWWLGIGVGSISGVAPDSRDVSGEAFGIAREMVESAKKRTRRATGKPRRSWWLRFAGTDPERDAAIEGCLAAISTIVESRSKREHEVAALLSRGLAEQHEMAEILGVSQPAISKAIDRSQWDYEQALARSVRFLGRTIK